MAFPARLFSILLVVGSICVPFARATDAVSDDIDELLDLSIDELMAMEVSSVEGVDKPWFQTPAAMYVISEEDIQRSGHKILPELFRLVPGMQVARMNSHKWAISSRGFNNRWSNKLLVMIDGRSIYDGMFGGVYWHAQDILLEDIQRIEVIRGPGATLWGANAVNGVINILTKDAEETQGALVKGSYGSHVQGQGATRFGGQANESTHYRLWSQYSNRVGYQYVGGLNSSDDWENLRGGWRIDSKPADRPALMIQGEGFGVNQAGLDQTVTAQRLFDDKANGGFLLARLSHQSSETEGWQCRVYWDYLNANQSDAIAGNGRTIKGLQEIRHQTDIDFRHYTAWLEDHQVMWGLGYRFTTDDIKPVQEVIAPGFMLTHFGFDPVKRDIHVASGFLQDTWTLLPETLFMIAGSKFEYNDYTGFEVQPSVRLSYTPDTRQTIWGAVSRPVRTAVRWGQDMVVFNNRWGDPYFTSEKAWTYELGYRREIAENLSADTAVFYTQYDGLRDLMNAKYGNLTDADSYGAELSLRWQTLPRWSQQFNYTFLEIEAQGPRDDTLFETVDPDHQCSWLSYLDITDSLQFNSGLYFVDHIEHGHNANLEVPSYWRLDLGLTWQLREQMELSLWGQNLLDDAHLEDVNNNFETDKEIERSAYLQLKWHFR